MAIIDKTYHELLRKILTEGRTYEDPNRRGTSRVQIPSYQLEHYFKDGFPILTTKETYFKGAVGELLVFLSGSTDIRSLWDKGIHFWDKDWQNFHRMNDATVASVKEVKDVAYQDELFIQGSPYWLGKIYPYYMRSWRQGPVCDMPFNPEGSLINPCSINVDQIRNLIDTLKDNPMATKKTVTMWNPAELADSCLTPCHWSFEALVEPLEDNVHSKVWRFSDSPKYSLTIKWHQHSVDTFLGLPINIMYYSLLCYVLAKLVNMKPKGVIGDLSNVHIYAPHLLAVNTQLNRSVTKYDASYLSLNKNVHHIYEIDGFIEKARVSDFELLDYESYPKIKAEMLAYKK